jgi:hypothetical protein
VTDVRLLLERHKPRLVYDSHEAYFADAAAIWTDSPTNVLKRGDGTVLARPPKLSLAYLSTYAAARTDAIGDTTRSYAKNAAKAHANPAYRNRAHAHARRDAQGRLWLQYWLFYYYNDYQLLGPLSGGNHEGDWELVQLRLDAGAKPVQAVYSQHKQAESRRFIGTTPIVYVARGSHANYFSAGTHWTGTWLDQADGRGPQIVPRLDILDDATPWALWPGTWGDTKPGALPLDSGSPRSPGVRPHWLDPAKLDGAAPAPAPKAPPPPQATVRRAADRLVVRYTAPAGATALAVALRPAASDVPAVTRAFAIESPSGELELPAGDGDYEVWASVVDAEGVPSAGARAR